jgi:hypothetical protein
LGVLLDLDPAGEIGVERRVNGLPIDSAAV